MRTYYSVCKKFHTKELPRTNYDCLKEEKLELDGLTEAEILEKIKSEYSPLLSQTKAL